MVMLGIVLRRVMGDHEFQPLHRPQSALESFSSLDNVIHVGVVQRLGSQGGVVRSRVEKRGLGEVWEHCERDIQSAGESLEESIYGDVPVLVWMPPISCALGDRH